MNDNTPTLLDRLDQTPVGPAPITELLAAGRAAKRRRRRLAIAGTAAGTALVLGGGTLVAQSLASNGTGLFADDSDLTVRITHPLPTQAERPGVRNVRAIWDADHKSLTYVTGMHYSGSCPPTGTATMSAQGAVSLEIQEDTGPGVCTADAGQYTAVIEGLTSAPTALRVTELGKTRTVPFVRIGPGLKEQESAASTPKRLECPNDAVVSTAGGLHEQEANLHGSGTPEEAVEEFLPGIGLAGHQYVIDVPEAWVLRPDGTAIARLDFLISDGWTVDGYDLCLRRDPNASAH